MENSTKDQAAMNIADVNAELSLSGQSNVPLKDENNPPHKQSHHTSAMCAASVWHSTMQHVKHNHNHRGLNL